MRRRTYKNPPIEEAVCEFHCASDIEWNPTSLLDFHREIADSYPRALIQQNSVDAAPYAQGDQLETNSFLDQKFARIYFSDENSKNLVSVGRNIVSAHMLRPYQTWEDFRSRINDSLIKYSRAIPNDGIQRIGLRYINRIDIDHGGETNLNQYFSAVPILPPGISAGITRFYDRTEMIYNDEQINLALVFSDTESESNRATFLLDFDLVWDFGENLIDVDQAMDKVEILRERERDVFESMITEKLRENFDVMSD